MRIIFLADLHGRELSIDSLLSLNPEAVLVGGDITNFGSGIRVLSQLAKLNELVPVLAVHGNCDPEVVRIRLEELGLSIDGKIREIRGMQFFGIGGSSPTPFPTPGERSEEELYEIFLSNRDELKVGYILLTHSPPFATKLDCLPNGEHVGSKSIRRIIEESRPALCLCGHIHEARGKDKLGETIVVNPSPYAIAIIEIQKGKTRISFWEQE